MFVLGYVYKDSIPNIESLKSIITNLIVVCLVLIILLEAWMILKQFLDKDYNDMKSM